MAKISKQALPAAYHGHQATVAGEVFLVLLKVVRDMIDTLCEHSYLCFYRPCVGFTGTKRFENIRFLFSCKMRHLHQKFKINTFFRGAKIVNIVKKTEFRGLEIKNGMSEYAFTLILPL